MTRPGSNDAHRGSPLRFRTALAGVALLALSSFAAVVAAPAASPGRAASREDVARAEARIAEGMAKGNVAGLSVAVVSEGELIWSSGYGFADLENFVPFTANTVWRLGSVSKPLTAVAAMQQVERGRLDLDAPVQRYCPAFPAKPWPITPRLVLGHLAGIRHYGEKENFNSTRHYASVTESLEAFQADPLVHSPGTYTYSTYGYVVLGCIVEGASGRRFEDYLRENVTDPAGMTRTRTDDHDAIVPNRARGYARLPDGRWRNADLADTSNKVPGGGMVSTAVDLARFAIALESNRILKRETFAAMQVPMKMADGKESPYFGWTIGDRNGDRMLTHSGSQQGTSTYLLMIPARRFAVAVIANTEDVNTGDIAKGIAAVFLP